MSTVNLFPYGLVLQKQETMHFELAPKYCDSWGLGVYRPNPEC